MLVHTGSLLTVTWARLDEAGNARQPTEFKFVLMDLSDAAFLELAAAVRAHKAELSADLEKALAEQRLAARVAAPVIEGELVKKPRIRKPAKK